MKLNRQDTPPETKDVLWVERLKGGVKGSFTVYSPKLWGVWTHYHKGRSKPCFLDDKLCIGGCVENNKKWYGYVHCWHLERNRQVIFQATPAGARMWLNQCVNGCSLRGMTIEACRTNADNGRQRILVSKWKNSGFRDDLPPPLDPTKSLFNMWDLEYQEVAIAKEEIVTVDQIPEGDDPAEVPLKTLRSG